MSHTLDIREPPHIVFPLSVSVCVYVIPCALYVSKQVVKVSPPRLCLCMLWQCGTGCQALSLSLSHQAFCVSEQLGSPFSEKPRCAVLHGAFAVRCNLNVCSYHLRDFICRVTRTHSLPPVKPPLAPSPASIPPSTLPLPLKFSLLTFCLPPLCSLSAFFLALPFPSLREFPNCLHFLSAPSFFSQNQLDYIHPALQFSLLVILSECF